MVIWASLRLHEGIVHRPDFKAVVIQREILLSIKLKHALCASTNTVMCVQGILRRKMVSSKQPRNCKVL